MVCREERASDENSSLGHAKTRVNCRIEEPGQLDNLAITQGYDIERAQTERRPLIASKGQLPARPIALLSA